MNKEKIVEELNEYMKSIDTNLRVEEACGDLDLRYIDYFAACFKNFDLAKPTFYYIGEYEVVSAFLKNNYLGKFYRKAVELMDKYGAKYTVQVLPSEYGFLYKRCGDVNDLTVDELKLHDDAFHRRNNNHFTKSEIEELKKRDDVAIDWDKAIIKEVTD